MAVHQRLMKDSFRLRPVGCPRECNSVSAYVCEKVCVLSQNANTGAHTYLHSDLCRLQTNLDIEECKGLVCLILLPYTYLQYEHKH